MDLLLQALEGTVCPHCEGRGMRIIEDGGGRRHAEPCICRREQRLQRAMQRAQIPENFRKATLDNYDGSLARKGWKIAHALEAARTFVADYPLETAGTGLLFTGSVGVGKTHLAVGTLKALILERGAQGVFYDYRELLKAVQNSYNQNVAATELEVLAPVFNAEILVLDEIGAAKPTDWVWDTVAHILNNRYNERRTTIMTTNYPNLPPLAALTEEEKNSISPTLREMKHEITLGDRIGERMRSRLQEMCAVIEVTGPDYRSNEKKAKRM